uniref:glutathione transferase n=1 Tax=Phocoena sinus TaxID=42100 RepID=A0A8C9C2B9_PHOSS
FLGGQGRWKIRLAHAIRLVGLRGGLFHCIYFTTAPYDRTWWPNRPGLLFLQLPYLIDGAHRLTQSNTILCYIARMYNMCEWSCGWGRGTGGHIRVDVLENQVMDVRLCMAMICYSSDFEKLKPDYLKEIPKTMKLFSDFLGKRPWFAGDKGLKKISAYMKSSCFLPGPLFLKTAMWGNKYCPVTRRWE